MISLYVELHVFTLRLHVRVQQFYVVLGGGGVIKDRSYLSLEQQMCTDPNIHSLQSLHSISETKHFSPF